MNKFTKLKNIFIINLRFKEICTKNNLQEIKKFYEDDYLNYHYKIINENKSIDLTNINKSITSIFHNYLYHNITKREILLWFVSLDIISNKSYNDIYYDLCIKKNLEKARFLQELKLVTLNEH
jgi:hypothetical protein